MNACFRLFHHLLLESLHTLRMGLPKVPQVHPNLSFGTTQSDVWRTKPVGFLESLHTEDRVYFDSMAGSLTHEVERLAELCMATVRGSEEDMVAAERPLRRQGCATARPALLPLSPSSSLPP